MSPIYEYECEKCGVIETRRQHSFRSEPEPICSCGQIMNRKISSFSFIFALPNTPKSKVNPKARVVK